MMLRRFFTKDPRPGGVGRRRRRSSMSTMMMMIVSCLLVMTTRNHNNNHQIHAAPLHDLIIELPGYGRPPTPHFSGYLDASDGCDTAVNGPICKIHYWLALADKENKNENEDEATSSNDSKSTTATTSPTVLWLNGGPGSSSILGWLQEVGPLLMNASGGLMENPYSWTKAGVNLLAIEAPMGVGFSYCSSQLDDGKACMNSDTSTAQASRAALVDFFTTKFPELAPGPFYIAGESYAGVYIPTLSKELLEHPTSKDVVPLEGIMVGDPCTDNKVQRESMDSLWYSNKYGMMDSDVYDTLTSDDCDGIYDTSKKSVMMQLMSQRNFTGSDGGYLSSKSHQSIGKKWSNHVTASELNNELRAIDNLTERRRMAEALYQERVLGMDVVTTDIDGGGDGGDGVSIEVDVVDSSSLSSSSGKKNLREASTNNDGTVTRPAIPDKCKLANRKFLLSSSNSLSQGWSDLYIDDYSLFAPVTSKEDEQMADYLNSPAVRRALNVEEAPVKTWPSPDVGFIYHKEYNACNWQPNIKYPTTSMIDIYQEIIPHLSRTWIYNGDTDPCVSYEGTREAVKQILFDELDGGSYRPWFYNQTGASLKVLEEKAIKFGPNLVAQSLEAAQFGGEVVDYQSGLKFITFHGSGHMVPQFRPQAALHFLTKFIHGNVDVNANSNVNNKDEATSLVQNKNDFSLSPLFESNSTLLGYNEIEFRDYMKEWTESAMTQPYVRPVHD
mmetsp:Transcript_27957/g.31408  ORF Transcript_27957/g.31408 Transcript_27957/m.31408 type:complete len:726 (+) Transcript_27957:93-2270(+)